jgi:hypothetical protein
VPQKEIILRKLKLSDDEFAQAVMEVDDDIITLEISKAIRTYIPTNDIFELIVGYEGPIELLARSDVFLANLYQIPRVAERFNALTFRLQFYQDYIELEPVSYS